MKMKNTHVVDFYGFSHKPRIPYPERVFYTVWGRHSASWRMSLIRVYHKTHWSAVSMVDHDPWATEKVRHSVPSRRRPISRGKTTYETDNTRIQVAPRNHFNCSWTLLGSVSELTFEFELNLRWNVLLTVKIQQSSVFLGTKW